MTSQHLSLMSDDELVKRFAAICIEQDLALVDNDIARVGHLYWELECIEHELKSRLGDGRVRLTVLYGHRNMQVRLKAAAATLVVAAEDAHRQLKEIKGSNWQPQAGEAGMLLWSIHRGIFKPT